MLEELRKYKYIKKSKYELEVDKINEDMNRRLWNSYGYYELFYLGSINQLKVIADYLKKSDTIGRDDIRELLKGYQTIDDVPYNIKNLISVILEEFDDKE